MAKIIKKRIWLSNPAKRRRKLLAALLQAQTTAPATPSRNLDFLILPKRAKKLRKPPRIRRGHKRKQKLLKQQLWLISRASSVNVPFVEGVLLPSAQSALTNAGLGYQVTYTPSLIYPFNTVISQNPKRDVSVAVGTVVQLLVSSGWAVIPEERGRQITLAVADSIALGLLPQITYRVSLTDTPGNVTKQAPKAGDKVLIGSPIFFTVAAAPPPPVPRTQLPSTGDIVTVITSTD